MIDVYSDELAEALFHFVSKEERYIHFCKCCEISDLSIAEYVDKYCKSEFEEYFINQVYHDCPVFRGPVVTMKKYLDDEWLLVDSNTDEILFIGSKEKIMDEYDRRNQI